MHSIVDGTTAAMGVEVCSFYLADHERMRLTLAATNGLDRTQVGRVSLAWGEGITGRVAATRTPIAVEDVTVDERFAWVRGFDIEGLAGMLSVPLEWHDTVVGVLNVQTRDEAALRGRRDRPPPDDRRAPRRDRREGPADGRGRGAAGRIDRPRCCAGRAHERRDPRVADAAVGRPRLRRPAGRGCRRRNVQPRRGRVGRRRLRPARAARPARGFDPGVGPRRGPDRAVAGAVRRGRARSPRRSRRSGSCCARTRSAGIARTSR